jgi:N-acetylneuraminic acid mutarotase
MTHYSLCKPLLVILLTAILPLTCNGHFVWIVCEGGSYRVVFGEMPEADDAEMLKSVSAIALAQPNRRECISASVELATNSFEGWLTCSKTSIDQPITGSIIYGVVSRGQTRFLLHYRADYANVAVHQPCAPDAQARIQIIPHVAAEQLVLTVYQKGQPIADCELIVSSESSQTVKTDAAGQFRLPLTEDRVWARTKAVDLESGTWDDQTFEEKRSYATLVIDNSKLASVSASAEQALPDLPIAVTSFGAAVCRDQIFVYGGHTGVAHEYARTLQNAQLFSLDLNQPEAWKAETTGDDGVQGNALVAHGDQIYRLGGLQALNAEGESHVLRSRDSFDRFDFETKSWSPYPPLPQPRSSFDAVVIGDKVYVVGGWNLQSEAEPVWCEEAYEYDLSSGSAGSWRKLPRPPFQRRALAAGEYNGELFVIGGMDSDGSISTSVNIFNAQTQRWRDGIDLPNSNRMEGFGVACAKVDGNLIVATHSGRIYRFDAAQNNWQMIEQLDDSRFFSRLVPIREKRFAIIGGASMVSGKFVDVHVGKVNSLR